MEGDGEKGKWWRGDDEWRVERGDDEWRVVYRRKGGGEEMMNGEWWRGDDECRVVERR
jgi:hypothetical protein